MKYLLIAVLSGGLLVAANANAASAGAGHSLSPDSPFTDTGAAVQWSNAKERCKELGGKWKPIRRICKIDSITTPGL